MKKSAKPFYNIYYIYKDIRLSAPEEDARLAGQTS
jgi:hypothetical protein